MLGELTAVSAPAIFLSVPSLFLYFVAVAPTYNIIKRQLAECLSCANFLKPVRKRMDFFPLVTMDHLSEDLNFRCNIKIFYRVLKSWLIVF